jgi:hypothetical protein
MAPTDQSGPSRETAVQEEDLVELILWGKTVCLPLQTHVEWNIWHLARALERYVQKDSR